MPQSTPKRSDLIRENKNLKKQLALARDVIAINPADHDERWAKVTEALAVPGADLATALARIETVAGRMNTLASDERKQAEYAGQLTQAANRLQRERDILLKHIRELQDTFPNRDFSLTFTMPTKGLIEVVSWHETKGKGGRKKRVEHVDHEAAFGKAIADLLAMQVGRTKLAVASATEEDDAERPGPGDYLSGGNVGDDDA